MDIYIGVKDTRQTVDYKLLFHLFAYMFAHSEPYPSPCIRGQAGQTYRRLQTPSSALCVYVCPFRALPPPLCIICRLGRPTADSKLLLHLSACMFAHSEPYSPPLYSLQAG